MEPVVVALTVGQRPETAKRIGTYIGVLPNGPQWVLETERGLLFASIEPTKPASVRFSSCPEVEAWLSSLDDGHRLQVALATEHHVQRPSMCRICGCTTDHACLDGCWWADDTLSLCRQHPAF